MFCQVPLKGAVPLDVLIANKAVDICRFLRSSKSVDLHVVVLNERLHPLFKLTFLEVINDIIAVCLDSSRIFLEDCLAAHYLRGFHGLAAKWNKTGELVSMLWD